MPSNFYHVNSPQVRPEPADMVAAGEGGTQRPGGNKIMSEVFLTRLLSTKVCVCACVCVHVCVCVCALCLLSLISMTRVYRHIDAFPLVLFFSMETIYICVVLLKRSTQCKLKAQQDQNVITISLASSTIVCIDISTCVCKIEIMHIK